jgi:hypothetical protein
MYPIRMQYLATLASVSSELVSYCLRLCKLRAGFVLLKPEQVCKQCHDLENCVKKSEYLSTVPEEGSSSSITHLKEHRGDL